MNGGLIVPGGDFVRIKKKFNNIEKRYEKLTVLPVDMEYSKIVADEENKNSINGWKLLINKCIDEKNDLLKEVDDSLEDFRNHKHELQTKNKGGKLEQYLEYERKAETIKNELIESLKDDHNRASRS